MVNGLAPNALTWVRFPEASMFFSRRRLFSLCYARCVCSLAPPGVRLCCVVRVCTLGVCPLARGECR